MSGKLLNIKTIYERFTALRNHADFTRLERRRRGRERNRLLPFVYEESKRQARILNDLILARNCCLACALAKQDKNGRSSTNLIKCANNLKRDGQPEILRRVYHPISNWSKKFRQRKLSKNKIFCFSKAKAFF